MKIATIKFCSNNKISDYPIEKKQFKEGDYVLVDTNQIKELAHIVNIYQSDQDKPLKNTKGEGKIIRVIDVEDKKKINQLKQTAQKFISQCAAKAKNHGLRDMKIIDADLSFDAKKLTIYFSAEERIDFRILVSDLVRSFKKLIRLQQINARDQTKRFCGYGKCGRQTCCSTYIVNLEDVSFDLAKEQGLSDSGTGRAVGSCGKPMCCLRYETELYQKAQAKMPRIGLKLRTKQGIGEIVERNIFKNTVTVKLPDKTKVELPI